jgi:thymidylate synthase
MEIRASSLADAWEKGIRAILRHYQQTGETVITERDTTSIELENVVFVVDQPFAEPRFSHLHPNPEYLGAYSDNILDFKYQKDVYSRMLRTEYEQANINQLDEAVEKLKSKWFTSKAIITIWDPYVDIDSDHPPCTCLVQFYIRKGRLCLTSYFRSNDAWLCSHGDMVALTNLQKKVAEEVGVEVGTYTHFACCYHIYEYDIRAAMLKFK